MEKLGLRAMALAAVLALTAALPARAQEFPRWEFFGGFSYANVGLGPQASLRRKLHQHQFGNGWSASRILPGLRQATRSFGRVQSL